MVLAASTTRVPAGAVILCPSIVRLTSGTGPSGAARHLPTVWGGLRIGHVAGMAECVVLVLVTEVAQRRVDDPTARVAESAETAPVLQAVRDALQDVAIQLRALVAQDALVGPRRPVLADAARRAFAARLVRGEL